MNDEIGERLRSMALELPVGNRGSRLFEPAVESSGLLFVSGQTPRQHGELLVKGRLGAELTLEQGIEAARVAALVLLGVVEEHVGLERVERLVKLNGYVASTPSFVDQPRVVDGASDVLRTILGERGRHARIALGVASLPGGAPVELDLIAELKS